MSKKDIEKLLEMLESKIRDIRQGLHNGELNSSQLESSGLENSLKDLLGFLKSIDYEADREEKRKIYHNISQFIEEKFQADRKICRIATYSLLNESDRKLIDEDLISTSSEKIDDLTQQLKKYILTIKVYYEILRDLKKYKRTTEIFYVNPYASSPAVKRIEEEESWDNMPSDLRESLLLGENSTIGYKLYPQDN